MSNPLLDAARPTQPITTAPPPSQGGPTLLGVQLTPLASSPAVLQARVTELEAQLRQAQDEITGNRDMVNAAEGVRTQRTVLAMAVAVLAFGWWSAR